MALVIKNPPANVGEIRHVDWIPGSGIWRAWQSTPVSLPGETHGERGLAGYSMWGGKELDMVKATEHRT